MGGIAVGRAGIGHAGIATSGEAQRDWLKQIERSYMQAQVPVGCTTAAVTAYYTSALAVAAAQNGEANQRLEAWSKHCADQDRAIGARDREISALREALALQSKTIEALRAEMSDPPQGDVAQSADPDAPPKRGPVDEVCEALDKRLVSRTDRGRLRGALDKADAPLGGRAGADEALGRVTRFVAPSSAMDWAR